MRLPCDSNLWGVRDMCMHGAVILILGRARVEGLNTKIWAKQMVREGFMNHDAQVSMLCSS